MVRFGKVILGILLIILISGMFFWVGRSVKDVFELGKIDDEQRDIMFKLKAFNMFSKSMAILKPDIVIDCSADAPASEMYVEFKPVERRELEKVDLECVDQYDYILQTYNKKNKALREGIYLNRGCDKVDNEYDVDMELFKAVWKCPRRNCEYREVTKYDHAVNWYSKEAGQHIAPRWLKLSGLENMKCHIKMSAGK